MNNTELQKLSDSQKRQKQADLSDSGQPSLQSYRVRPYLQRSKPKCLKKIVSYIYNLFFLIK